MLQRLLARLDTLAGLDIYLLGLDPGDDAAVRDWATRQSIAPEWVRTRRVTLNHDGGALADLTEGKGKVPYLLRRRGGDARCPPGGEAVTVLARLPAFRTWAFLLSLMLSPLDLAYAAVPAGYRLVARSHQVPPEVLYAVGLAESARRVDSAGTLRPWPWTLNLSGRGVFCSTRREAREALEGFLDTGQTSVDIGLMQVNWRYHRRRLGSPERALDPYHNLQVAAEILQTCHRDRRDWWAAVGCYHAPGDADRAGRYRDRYPPRKCEARGG